MFTITSNSVAHWFASLAATLSLLGTLGLTLAPSVAFGQRLWGHTDTLVVTLDPAGDGNGFIRIVGIPSLAGSHASVTTSLFDDSGQIGQNLTFVQLRWSADEQTHAAGELKTIYQSPFTPPGASLPVTSAVPFVNDSGSFAFDFRTQIPFPGFDEHSIYIAKGDSLVLVARTGDPYFGGGGGSFFTFEGLGYNDEGRIGFRNETTSPDAFFRSAGVAGTDVKLIEVGQTIRGGGATYASFDDTTVGSRNLAVFGEGGDLAVVATLAGTAADADRGIYRASGGLSATEIAREGQAVPHATSPYDELNDFTSLSINAGGDVAFTASLRSDSTSFTSGGLFYSDGGTLVEIARVGDPVPLRGDGGPQTATYLGLINPELNNAGQMVFRSSNNFTNIASALLLYSDGVVKPIVENRQPIPGETSVATGFGTLGLTEFQLNNNGQVVFQTGALDLAPKDLFLGDTEEIIAVVKEGQPLAGSTVTGIEVLWDRRPGKRLLNDFGQVTYKATLADGREGVFLFTPDIHWRAETGGEWSDKTNWTVGLSPAAPHDVLIDPAPGSLAIHGPNVDATMRSLTVGGIISATLVTDRGGNLTILADLKVGAGSSLNHDAGLLTARRLENDGRLVVGKTIVVHDRLANRGDVELSGGTLNGGTLVNEASGAVSGSGTINNKVVNHGMIQPNGGASSELKVVGALENFGQITIANSETLRTAAAVAHYGAITLINGGMQAEAGLRLKNLSTLTGSGEVNGDVFGESGSLITAGSALSLGNADSSLGFHTEGQINVGIGRSLTLRSQNFANLGLLSTVEGVLTASNGVVLGPGDVLQSGTAATVDARIAAAPGSTIQANGNLTIGDAAARDGFFSDGALRVGDSTITLADANDAVFASAALVALGKAGNPGTLAAANGLTLNFGGNIVGHGTIDTPNDPLRPTIINGHAAGNSAAEPLTFNGYVKGVGSFADIVFNGTFAPGLSPATVETGNLAFGSQSVLQIELGGFAPGREHDQLIVGGSLQLDGTLLVELIDGFNPSVGDQFEILTYESLSGEFDNVVFAGALRGVVDYGASSLVLTVTTPVPEPSTAVLAAVALLAAFLRVGRSRNTRGSRRGRTDASDAA